MWFRSDLRVRDNTALAAACGRAGRDASGGVVGVFVVTPGQWREHDWGEPKADFVLRSVAALKEDLAGRNIPLKVLTADLFDGTADALLGLAKETSCGSLFFNREYELNESRRDEAVGEAFEAAGLPVHAFTDQVVFTPGTVKTKQDGWYSVYSPFKKRWRELYKEGEGSTSTGLPKKQPEIAVRADAAPTGADGYGLDTSAGPDEERGIRPDLWAAGEDAAGSRLEKFIASRAGAYKDDRDFPSINGTSTLSPYLAVGAVSPRQCLEAALSANQNKIDSGSTGVVGWIEELIWREFYKHLLVAYPRLSMGRPFRKDMDSVEWSRDEDAFGRWCRGETGYPIVDAGMRQLNRTGWMHNRLRMIVAMFLTKDLMIDWRWGERYFAERLVDLDYGSNNGGWQWSASTGTDAQPYFRIFNPTTQGEKFDKEGSFIKKFVPELAGLEGKAVHRPSETGLFDSGDLGYPGPMVDHREARERALAAFKGVSG